MSPAPRGSEAVAHLARSIAGDAMLLGEVLEDIIAEGGEPRTITRLAAAMAVVARVGLVADRLNVSHGGHPMLGAPRLAHAVSAEAEAYDALGADCMHKAVLG